MDDSPQRRHMSSSPPAQPLANLVTPLGIWRASTPSPYIYSILTLGIYFYNKSSLTSYPPFFSLAALAIATTAMVVGFTFGELLSD
jgi:hypothetical protein